MESIIPEVLLFFSKSLESFIAIYFNYLLLGTKKIVWKKSVLLGILLGLFWYVSGGNQLIYILIYFGLMVGGLFFLRASDSIVEIIICAIITSNISLILEHMAATFTCGFVNKYYQMVINDSLLNFFVYTVASILILILYFLLRMWNVSLFEEQNKLPWSLKGVVFPNKDTSKSNEIINEYYKVILIYIIQVRLLTLYIYLSNSIKEKMTIELVILLLNLITILIIKKLYETMHEQYQRKIYELKSAHIDERNKMHQQYKHDLKNHMNIISILAKEKNNDKLISYVSRYQVEINQNLLSVNTGLSELDILLYSKISNAQSKNITINFKCTANIKCNNCIIDLNSIMGNLLDNAIEACEKSEQRLLSIYIKEDPLDYIFIVENTFENHDLLSPDTLFQKGISTKGLGRGNGLSIVKRIVEKYHGTINLIIDEDIFRIQIDLPK